MRIDLHVSESRCGRNSHKNQWLRQLMELGLSPEMRVLETIENSNDLDWQEREQWWIQAGRETGDDLTNLDSGGRNGMKKCEETKQKISMSNMGKKMSPEAIAKMKATKAARMTPEVRERMRQAQLGKKQSAETIAKRAAAMTGRVVSEETRRKLSASKKGKPLHPNTRAAGIAANTGRIATEAQRAAQSERLKGRAPSPQTIAASIAAHTGRIVSDETRAKQRASRAAYFSRKKTLATSD